MDITLLFLISRSLVADETWQEIKKVWGQNPEWIGSFLKIFFLHSAKFNF
jgi:hypothetical protein